jgi:hypothetical protein
VEVVGLYEPTTADREVYSRMSVVILTPCKDYEVPARFAKSVVNLVAYSWMHGLPVYQMGVTERMVIHWARSDLARIVRDKQNEYTGERFTHVLWLDDDHVFNPDLLVYLARHGDLDMVSALYYGRAGRHLPVVYVKDQNPDKYKHYPLVEVPPKLCEVDAVGFGALLMRRDVLDRMEEPYFRFNDCGEDIYFCVHARERGMRVFVDGSYMLGHLGDMQTVTHETYLQYMRDNEETFRDRIKVPLGGQNGRSVADG